MADGSQATAQSLYRFTPRQTREAVIDCMEAGLVPMITSSPGMGKSSIVKSINDHFGLVTIDERLSTRSPVDLAGLPHFRGEGDLQRASWIPFDTYPIEGTPLPKGKNGWTIFFDEFNSGTKATQAAAYKIVLDRMTGLHRLHENVAIVCAGNMSSDRAIVNSMSTAMQSRLVHIEMQISHSEWLEDVALKENYDSRVVGYLNFKKEHLMDFKPDHQEKTFSCPRTWEFMNRLIKGKEIQDRKIPLYAGTVTSGVAVSFVQFCKVYKDLPTIREIVNDPKGCKIPQDNAGRWGVISYMMGHVDNDNFADLSAYTDRFSTEFKVLFFRSALIRHPKLRSHPDFASAAVKLSKYLHED